MVEQTGFGVSAREVDRAIAVVENADPARPFTFADEQVWEPQRLVMPTQRLDALFQ